VKAFSTKPVEARTASVWSPAFRPSGKRAIRFRTALRPDSKRFCSGGIDLCVVEAVDRNPLKQADLFDLGPAMAKSLAPSAPDPLVLGLSNGLGPA